jgi:beta-galactosidase
MRTRLYLLSAAVLGVMAAASVAVCADSAAVPLPEGVRAVWDMSKAYHETTPTRERICINGLWRWQPAKEKSDQPPTANWGYFKVPGSWPGITDYQEKDSQTLYSHPSWKGERISGVNVAWYQREIVVPKEWAGRRVVLSTQYLNSRATVFVDGKKIDEMIFPAGEVDITAACSPGSKHTLSMLVAAVSRRGPAQYSYDNPTGKTDSSVKRRGLCGDVYLIGTPSAARITDVKVDPSVRKSEITFDTGVQDLAAGAQYAIQSVITEKGKKVAEFTSKPFTAADVKNGRIKVTEKWKAEKLWDIHTPQNTYEASVSLVAADKKVLDEAIAVRFGFREIWIDGRDLYLNGTRIFLSSVPLDNSLVGATMACYEGAKESLSRLKDTGINMVYTHNYSCEPGSHVSFDEVFRAADDVGMLISVTQPHFSRYNWKDADAEQKNGYASLAEFYVRVSENHPSVVFYSTSHNTGYHGDMDPEMIDGTTDPRTGKSKDQETNALQAEAVINHLDPTRIVYHHACGNVGTMHTINFYANMVAVQEMDDWFEHWATVGTKPVFTCEYGTPFTWDWAMYRGLYKGKQVWGNAVVPWEYCNAEWNSQFFGDQAYKILEPEKEILRWEAKQFQEGKLWHRWDYPNGMKLGTEKLTDEYAVWAEYFTNNWRAFRAWNMSANSPWELSHLWTLRNGVNKARKELKVDWDNLQRPGVSPDYLDARYERFDLAFERSDWIPTVAAKALVANNSPLLAYIAGKSAAFTSKDHNYLAGETLEKQLIVINNCRETVDCQCSWSLGVSPAVTGQKTVKIVTGQQERIPLKFELPANLAPGKYELTATVKYSNGETQKDSFAINVLPPPVAAKPAAKIALWDPKGQTGKLLESLGVKCQPVAADADLAGYDVLIVGKSAFSPDGAGPNVAAVRNGLKVIVFEQDAKTLEQRFGFRVDEYGLRNAFNRMSDHPALAGLDVQNLRDWRGEATLLAPRLEREGAHAVDMLKWCDIKLQRLWRCGCRGNVASVLIEKPAHGDFLPIIDGGYSLQYSPLMEYREGKGMVMFCQMDVSGRTETDPAADQLTRNLISYVSDWKPAASRQALYVGDAAGKSHLEKAGITAGAYEGGKPSADQVLIVGPAAGQKLAANAVAIREWLATGGRVLGIGLDQAEAKELVPGVTMKKGEHIATFFEPFGVSSPLAGVGPADVHNREPKQFSLVSGGATVIGDGILATAPTGSVVFCQLVPWQCDYSKEKLNVKRTFRRSSCLVERLLGNMGVEIATPVLTRFSSPVDTAKAEKRWSNGLYLDQPEDWDNPYRAFRW